MFGREPKGEGAARAEGPRSKPARATSLPRRSLRARLVVVALISVGAAAALIAGAAGLALAGAAEGLWSPLVGALLLIPVAALAAAGVGLAAAHALHRSLARPITALTRSLDEAGRSLDLEDAVDTASGDEIGRLAGGLDQMLEQIRARDERNSLHAMELEREIAARRRDLSMAERAIQTKSDLLAAIGREIHAPMSGLSAMAETLAGGEAIARSSSSLLALADDLLGFPHVALGRIELQPAPTELSALAEDVSSLFWRAAAAKGLDLAAYVDPATPKAIEADPVRLRQVLALLVNHAIRSTEAGGVLIEIEPDTAASVRISVRDTGAGIPKDRLETVFDFEEAENIGLAVCKRLVEAMDGRFHLASHVGKGSTFAFRLTARALEPAAGWPGARPDAARALIAHDGVATRRALGRYLARAGYGLCRPGDGAAPDLVLGAPGPIADLFPLAPTICIAAHGDPAAHELLERGLAQALLAQPFRRAELEALLRQAEARAPLADVRPERVADAPPPRPAARGAVLPLPLVAPEPVPMAAPGVIVTRAAPPPDVRSLLSDLDEALRSDQLSLVYQPQFDREGHQILGVETLVRWTHPTRGVVSPVDFITVAEAWGEIRKLTDWVMTRAVEETADLKTLQVAFNASALEFTDEGIVERIKALLDRTGFDPRRLEIEITETAILSNEDQVRENMNELRDMGLKVALDDFGAGYSSLGHLRRYPFDKLKIDREFVTDCTGDVQSATVVHAVVSIGRALGMKVVAEGVETEQQRQFLKIAGVHAMQGYLFGRPLPIEELKQVILAPPRPLRALG